MKNFRAFLPLALIILAACAPQASAPTPAAPEIVYGGNASQVFSVVVRAISTSPGLPDSNGWIITQSDAAGGFVSAETTVSTRGLFSAEPIVSRESISVVVSDNTNDQTAVITQFTSGASALAALVHAQLTSEFGEPIKGGALAPSN